MPVVKNGDIRVYYEIEGSGPALVLQHATMMNLQYWYEFGYVDKLKETHRLILVDARGHGNSDKPHDSNAYKLENRINDVLVVMDDLGVATAHYMGYSLGAWIGFGLAAHAPQRIRSFILGGAHPYSESAAVFSGIDGSDANEFVAAVERFLGISIAPLLRKRILKNDLRALAAALVDDRESLEEMLPTMKMPVLLYCGEHDPRYDGVLKCASTLSKADLLVLKAENHATANMQVEVVANRVLEFLGTVEREV